MTKIIDMTEALKKKIVEDKLNNAEVDKAAEWTPIQALDYARDLIELDGADELVLIWTRPGVIDHPDESYQTKTVQFILSQTDRSDVFALLVHMGKRLVDQWF